MLDISSLCALDFELSIHVGATALPEAVNLESAREVARVIRTVRRLEREQSCRVRLIGIDSFLEFLPSGDVETLDRASRGLRAVAKVCRACVLVGHHPNAEGK